MGQRLASEIPIVNQEYNPKRQFYIASLNEALNPGGIYVLAMSYQGYLNNNDMKGFYRSSYVDDNEKTM